jgi:hypothetical protein
MMSVKWLFTISFILLAGVVCTVKAEPFAVQASSSCMANNDSASGPTNSRVDVTISDIRNYENAAGDTTRRRVAYYRYDISALKQPGKVFGGSYLTLNVDKRDSSSSHIYVYAVNEALDDIAAFTSASTYSSLPGLMNDPLPILGQELTVNSLDAAEISPLLLSYLPVTMDVWESTPTSSALDDVLNADTDGVVILMYLCYDPQTSGLEIRSNTNTTVEPVTAKQGIILRGEMSNDKAYNPVPANGASVTLDLAQLSWTNPEPNLPSGILTCDVYFHEVDTDPNTSDDPNSALPGYGYMTLATGISGHSVALPSGTLTRQKTYRWIVDMHDTTRVPQKTQGFLWSFNTNNIPPVVDAGNTQYLWLNNAGNPSSATVSLNGTVTDDNYPSPYTVLWTQDSGPATVTISPNNVKDITLVLPQAGTYKFKLTANDSAASGADVVYVIVGATPCAAAQAMPGYTALSGDFDADCIVNMTDFAMMAQNWLCDKLLSNCD